ncbi:uncharacterized protein LOC100568671 [Acyrthosiphon pisum]|uniref:Activating transcription factor 7-interacting protein Fn3 domain-containing protein n=1 Tax=Acyrthosiphon pisum TaxID=7029 RepID=A0A8R1W5U1_ACYPI|nr:uncharacterized protein LOC100568671 [Acyrthosiphon pisum]|eukprot:XP_003244481.1 PREDICTED: uncharacterized protein LOC100568671 [Acyrthosiphon pisum]
MSNSKKDNTVMRKPCPKSKRRWVDQDEDGPSKVLVRKGGLLSMAKAAIGAAVAVLGSAEEDVLEEAVHDKTELAMQVVYGSSSSGVVSKNTSSYPPVPRHTVNSSWKKVPLAPVLTVSAVNDVVTLVWDERATASMLPKYARVKGYEVFGYRGDTPSGDAWTKIGYFKAERLPMKCKLVYRRKDVVHNYAVRAVDVHDRCAPCAVVQILPRRGFE